MQFHTFVALPEAHGTKNTNTFWEIRIKRHIMVRCSGFSAIAFSNSVAKRAPRMSGTEWIIA